MSGRDQSGIPWSLVSVSSRARGVSPRAAVCRRGPPGHTRAVLLQRLAGDRRWVAAHTDHDRYVYDTTPAECTVVSLHEDCM